MFRAFFVLWLSAFAFENCNAHVRHANDVSLYSKFIQQQCLQKSQPENVSVKPSQTQCVTYYSPLNTFSVDIIVEGHFENQSLAQLQISYTEVSDDIKNSWSSFRTSQGQFSIPLIDEPIPKSTILCFSNNNQNEKDTTHVHYCIIPSVSSHSRESPSYKSTSPYETTVGILVKGLFRNIVVTTFKRLVLALDACLQIEDQFMEVFGPMLGPSKVSSNESLTQRKEVELELKEQDEELRTSQHVDEALWMSQFRNFLFIAFVGGWTILWLAPKKFKLLKRFLIFLTGFLRETPQWIREQLMLFLRPGEIKESNSESLEKKFPPEVLEKIFSHLTPKDLLTTRRVSSSLRDVIDTTRVWDTKYRELFKTEPIKNAPGPIRLCDRETFFYRQCAETNMANSGRPKFRSVEFLDVHQSSVLCVSSCNNIVVSYAANSTTISANSATPLPPVHQQYFPDPNHRFQHEHLGIIHVCDTITEKLLQSICVPTRVKLLKVCKLAPDHIIVYGESGHDNAFREGNLFVWNFVPRDNRAPSNLFYGDRVYRTTQPGCWVPKWSRSIYRNDIYDQFAEVKAVEFLDMVPLPNLGLAVMTASHTANLIHFWSLQSWGKYLVSIQTEFKYIWDVLPLEYDRNTFIYVVGDTFLDVFKFEKSFSRFLKVHRVSLSELFDLNLTLIQGNVVNQLHTSLENMPWSMKVKINEISQKLQFLILHRRGNARTIVHHCLVSYHNPFSFVLSSKWETELFAKFSAVDFNEHMAVLAKENSTTIHRLPLVPPSITGGKKAVARPLFENTGSVTCLHVTDDKICVGCEGLNSVHIWDFSCMESPKPNTTPGGAEILKITWLLLTHTFAIRTQQMYSSKFLHHWRRVVSLTLSLLPIFLIFFLNSCYTGIVLLLVLYFMLCSSKSSVRKHPLRFLLIILIVGEWHSAITTPENSLFYRLSPHQDSNLYYYIDTQSDINGSLSLMQYMPLLWLLILTSGIEIGMKSSSGGRAILSLPYSYYIMVVVLLNLAYYGDNQDDRHSVVSSFFFYDWWFIIIGLIKGLILHSMYDPLEIFAWILLPYVVEMIQVTLIGLASFVANVFFDSPVWSHLPPLLTLTNMILRTHMSCYIYFNNVIAVSMAAKEPSLFIKHGGLVAIYIVLLIIAYVVL